MDPLKPKCEFCGCSHITGLALIVCELQSVRARLAKALEKNTELNRRAQKAESAARETVEENRRKGQSFGRGLANWAATDYERRLKEVQQGRERDREEFRKGVAAWQDRIAAMTRALKKCDDEFDAMQQLESDLVVVARYMGLRAMIEEALKEKK